MGIFKSTAKMTALASGIVSASILALTMGGVQRAAAAPFGLLPSNALSVESPIIQARYRARGRSVTRARSGRRAVRSRYVLLNRGGNVAAAAMIGAFGAIVASAIAAESRRDRYVTHNPGYAYYPQQYGYAPVYQRPAVYYNDAYYQDQSYNTGGYYVKKKRRGIARIFGKPRRVYAPAYQAAPVYRPAYRAAAVTPYLAGPSRGYRPVRSYSPARSFRPARAVRQAHRGGARAFGRGRR
jgi:hypothetical protein